VIFVKKKLEIWPIYHMQNHNIKRKGNGLLMFGLQN